MSFEAPGVVRDPQKVRETADEILSRSEFSSRDGIWGSIRDFLENPTYYLELALNELLAVFFGQAGPLSQIFAWAVVAFVVAVAVAICVRLIRNTSQNDAVADPLVVPVDQTRADLLEQADRYEAAGEWRRAIRARHAALVAALAEDGVLRRRPGTTAREYLTQLSVNAPSAATSFERATTLFEWAWYGPTTPDANDAQRFRNLTDEVRRVASK